MKTILSVKCYCIRTEYMHHKIFSVFPCIIRYKKFYIIPTENLSPQNIRYKNNKVSYNVLTCFYVLSLGSV